MRRETRSHLCFMQNHIRLSLAGKTTRKANNILGSTHESRRMQRRQMKGYLVHAEQLAQHRSKSRRKAINPPCTQKAKLD